MSINGMKSGICGFAEEKEIILPIDGPQVRFYCRIVTLYKSFICYLVIDIPYFYNLFLI